MPGLSKVIVLDPDARAGRQVQLGFEREAIPTAVVATDALALPGEDTGLVVVGGCDGQGVELVRRTRAWLDDHRVDAPVVFAGRGVSWSDAITAGADEAVRHPAYLRDLVTIGRLLRGLPAGHRDHLVGNLIDVTSAFTLLRALAALGRSGTLTLVRGLRRGEVRFYLGEVTSAQVGMIHGQAALHQLLLWTDARFDFRHQDVVRRHQIPLAPEELFADAGRFLEGVRESSGGLSPAMVLAQDVPRLQSLAKQIPTEVYGVLRMFDGHRALADVLEDSAYRVFETLRVAQRAVEAGLLRAVETQPPRPTWRAYLAIEDWLVGSEPRDAAADSGPVASPRDAMTVTVRDARGAPPAATAGGSGKAGRKRKKRKPRRDTPRAIAIGAVAPREIDWGSLVPRTVGAEVGPLAGVVPASQVAGEIVTTAPLAAPERAAPGSGGGRGSAGEPSVVFDEAAEVAREAATRRAELEAHAEVERIAAEARAAEEAERSAEPQHAAERALAAAQAERAAAEARGVAEAELAAAALAGAEQAERAAAEAHASAIRVVAATVSVSSEPARVAADMDLVETKRERGFVAATPAGAGGVAGEPAFLGRPGVVETPAASAASDAVTAPHSAGVVPPSPITEPLPATFVPPGAITEPLPATFVPPGATTEPLPATFVPPGAITEPLPATFVPPGAITEPLPATFVPPGAITEPLPATFVPPGAITEPLPATFVPPGAITEPLPATFAPSEPIGEPPSAAAPAAAAAAASREPLAAAVPASREPLAETVPASREPLAAAASREPIAETAPASREPLAEAVPASREPLAAAATPRAAMSFAAAAEPITDASAPSSDAIAAPVDAMTSSGAITAPLFATTRPAPAAVSPASAEAAAVAPDPTPTEVSDEPSDGVVRQHIATAETAPVRRRPPGDRVDDDRPGDTTGEITMPRQRPPVVIRYSEPSILVADLAVVQEALGGALDEPVDAPPAADAASPEHAAAVAEVRGDAAEVVEDAAAFSDDEEAFFRAGHDRDATPAAPPTAESFADLDEGYRRVGFWERLRGKPSRPKGRGR